VDRMPKKEQPNKSSEQESLAQPLELRESLRIRDGLGVHEASPVRWPQLGSIRLTVSDLGYFGVSNN